MVYDICKNPKYYTKEHNELMLTLIRNFPGIKEVAETNQELTIETTSSDADFFISHMFDCDMIAMFFD